MPPDAPPDLAGAPRRFQARTAPGLRYWALSIGAPVGLGIASAALDALLPARIAHILTPILVLAWVGIPVAAIVRGALGRRVSLEVERGRLLVDGGRGGVFPLAGAALGPWRSPGMGVVSGTVLRVADGARSFRVLGLAHRPRPGVRVDLPASEAYDASLSAEELEALLALVPIAAADAGPPADLRCELFPHPMSARHALSMMAPWMATIGAAMAIAALFEATGLSDARYGQYLSAALIVPVVLAGLVLTIVRAQRRPPAMVLHLGPRELSLRDPKTGRVLFATPAGDLGGARGMHRLVARGVTFIHATLQLRLRGREDLTVGVYDPRFTWADPTPWLPAPRYIVSAPDWEALVTRLGLGAWMRGAPPR